MSLTQSSIDAKPAGPRPRRTGVRGFLTGFFLSLILGGAVASYLAALNKWLLAFG